MDRTSGGMRRRNQNIHHLSRNQVVSLSVGVLFDHTDSTFHRLWADLTTQETRKMDAKSLLRAKKAEAKIQHPYASYNAAGQLRCSICAIPGVSTCTGFAMDTQADDNQ